jgi:hypothetical protein
VATHLAHRKALDADLFESGTDMVETVRLDDRYDEIHRLLPGSTPQRPDASAVSRESHYKCRANWR